MYGLADVQTGDTRNVPAVLRNLVRMPFATVPWWKSLSMMNENKGVFGLVAIGGTWKGTSSASPRRSRRHWGG